MRICLCMGLALLALLMCAPVIEGQGAVGNGTGIGRKVAVSHAASLGRRGGGSPILHPPPAAVEVPL